MSTVKYGSLEEFILKEKPNKAFVIGIGGGGDILATIPTANWLRMLGISVTLGAVIWERWVVDPVPGPIQMEEMRNVDVICERIGIVNKKSYAMRGGKKVIPQIVNAARVLKEDMVAIDVSGGVQGVLKCLKMFVESENYDIVIGIDSGGDVLAVGGEKELWSPIADQIMLATLANLESPNAIGIFGLGTDGELPLNYIIERLKNIVRAGGYLGLRGITNKDIEMLEELMKHVITETTRAAINAAKCIDNSNIIRSGTRRVDLSLGILIPITVYLSTHVLFKQSKMAKAIVNTKSVWEVRDILNGMGIFTEIDLEIKIMEALKKGEKPNPYEIKENWYKTIGKDIT